MENNLSKKLTCFIDNNYIEHINLKKSIDDIKNLLNENNYNNLLSEINIEKLNEDKTKELIKYEVNKNYDKIINIINDKFNKLVNNQKTTKNLSTINETNIISQIKLPDFIKDESKLDKKINDFIQIIIKNYSLNNKIFLAEEHKKFKQEFDDKFIILKTENDKSFKEIRNEIDNKIIKRITEVDEKIYLLRNNIHRTFQDIDNTIKILKNDFHVKYTNIHRNEQIFKANLNDRFKNTNITIENNNTIIMQKIKSEITNDYNELTNNYNELKKQYIDVNNNQSELIKEINFMKNTIQELNSDISSLKTQLLESYTILNENIKFKNDKFIKNNSENNNQIISYTNNNLTKEIFEKVEIMISTKFVELNKYIIENAPKLVFSNRDFTSKIEIWIQSQIKLFLQEQT